MLGVRYSPLHRCMSVIVVWLAFVLSSMGVAVGVVLGLFVWVRVCEFLVVVGMVAGVGNEVEVQTLFDAPGLGLGMVGAESSLLLAAGSVGRSLGEGEAPEALIS